jgi:sortase A
VARVINGVGRTLVGAGVLVLLFVVYELWGTNIQEARSQRKLRAEFEQVIKVVTPTTVPGEPPPATPVGEAVATIRIPKIGLDKAVIEGVGVPDLKKGPGHYPSTPLPGQPGNAAIAGHRTTYGAPFDRLNELQPGDLIEVTTHQGNFKFRVDGSREVTPDQTEVLSQTDGAHLTLTTCTPRFSAKRRLVVSATLFTEPAPAPIVTVETRKKMVEVEVEVAGLSGDRSAAGPTVLWALLTTLIGIIAWLLARRFGRWRIYIPATPVFLVFLYVFFENVARLLPANI